MRRSLPDLAALTVVLVAIALSAVVRLRLADTPLERDEGEYAYAGQLVLRGIPPYSLARNMKFPGIYYAYAGVMAVFGETPRGIRLGLAVVNAATALLVLAMGRRLLGTFGGATAGVAFVLLTLDRGVLGVFGHATHFVMLPVLGGLLLLLRAAPPPRPCACLLAGVLLGTGVLMKQHGAAFVPLGMALALALSRRAPRGLRVAAGRAVLVGAGAAAPVAAVFGLLALQGVWDTFWFWTFTYAREYVSLVPLSEARPVFSESVRGVTRATAAIWACAGAGVLVVLALRQRPRARPALLGLLAASALAVVPGFYFRPHYYVVMLPSVALLTGAAASGVGRTLGALLPRGAAVALAAAGVAALAGAYVRGERDYLFSMSPRELIRDRYGTSPFPEMVEVARYVREHSGPGSRVAVIGSEPELYFYADRRSATGYLYTYPLMEKQPLAARMQEEMIGEIEAARPEYAVFVSVGDSLGRVPYWHERLLDWARAYLPERYDLVGVADLVSPEETRYAWDEAAASYHPVSKEVVYTYRRKEGD